ncbi:MAG: hypothetical protein HC852_15135 [Acaryochloridaceae cyanobacterium RU_4_10]|nr:hypothetical protein [Acaryochloridaceae cyanobacterium RU_4_10]
MKIVKQPLQALGVSLLGAIASTGLALPPVLAEQSAQPVTQAQSAMTDTVASKVDPSTVKVEPSIAPIPPSSTSPTPTGSVDPKESAPSATPSATGVFFITPTNGELLNKPATAVTIQSPLDRKIELRVNGQLVDQKFIGRTETDTSTQIVKQTWYGVVLQAGSNTLTAHEVGKPAPAASILLNVPGEPTQLKGQYC